jgi:hypothetical protein
LFFSYNIFCLFSSVPWYSEYECTITVVSLTSKTYTFLFVVYICVSPQPWSIKTIHLAEGGTHKNLENITSLNGIFYLCCFTTLMMSNVRITSIFITY